MNPWIERSIALAEGADYLDQLAAVYPLPREVPRRPLSAHDRTEVERLIAGENFTGLIRYMLGLNCFPYQEPYLGSFRVDLTSMDRNCETVRRIAEILQRMGRDKIIDGLEQPEQINRKLGSLFRLFVMRLPFPKLFRAEFEDADGISILRGADRSLMHFCNEVLGCNLSKGPDFVAKTPAGYVIGEAKFITTNGGNQDKSFREVINFIQTHDEHALRIGILDGVVWLEPRGLYGTVRNVEEIALSSLFLQGFLESQR